LTVDELRAHISDEALERGAAMVELDALRGDTIRSGREFTRRFFPRRYREKYIVGLPPSECPKCKRAPYHWSRALWGAWLCKDCGTFVRDEDRS
jgi:hypothetical protein